MHANTNLYYNSVFPSTIRAWNNLSEGIKQATSVMSFKFRQNRDINKPPKYYNVGSRIGQILQSRIRLECSLEKIRALRNYRDIYCEHENFCFEV